MINILNCDNMELMAKMPDKYYDISIIDPPYGIGAPNMKMGENVNRYKNKIRPESTSTKLKKNRLNSGSGSGKLKNRLLNSSVINWDNAKPSAEFWKELFRVSKNQVIWGGNYFTDHLPESRCWLCWDKKQPWDNFSQFELAWTSYDMPAAMFSMSNRGGNNNLDRIHPTEKPKDLYLWILNKFAKPGFKILDTHGGSMSNAIACYDLNFDLDICELDELYFNSSVARFEKYIKDKSPASEIPTTSTGQIKLV